MINAGPFTLTGPGPNPPGQVELGPPAGDVVGVQVINSGLFVLQAVTGGSGSFIPPGWCQTLLIQPGAAVIVTQSTAAGPETVTTVFANWLQPNDQPPPSGPYTQVPPTPTLLGEIPSTEVTSSITLYPSPLAWGVLVITSNPDFVAASEDGASFDPVSFVLPVWAMGNDMYYVPYLNAGAPTPQMVITWNGRGNGFFYEADEPLAPPAGITSLEATQTSTGSNLGVPGGSPFLTLGSTGGVAPSSVVGATTGISYPITAVSSELWSTFIAGWENEVTVTWPSSVTWYSAWSNTPFEEAASGGAPGTTVEDYIGAPIVLVANTPTQVAAVALAAGRWLILGRAQLNGTGPNTTLWLGPNSASAAGAYQGQATDTDGAVTVSKSVTLAAPATVYLNIQCSSAFSVEPDTTPFSGFSTGGNASGITAVRTA